MEEGGTERPGALGKSSKLGLFDGHLPAALRETPNRRSGRSWTGPTNATARAARNLRDRPLNLTAVLGTDVEAHMSINITRVSLSSVLGVALLLGCSSAENSSPNTFETADPGPSPALIDDPCTSTTECAAANAECYDVYEDGQNRCEASCTADADCGPQAICYHPPTGQPECFRTCSSPADCPSEGFRCFDAGSELPSKVCLPPCRLKDCTSSTFTYSCGSSESTILTDYQWAGANESFSATVTYSNGHVVQCSGQSSGSGWSGSCHDDTGAECTF